MKIQCIFKKFSGGQAPQTPLFFTSFYTEIVAAFYHVITPHFFLICCTCYLENNLEFFDSPAQNPGYAYAQLYSLHCTIVSRRVIEFLKPTVTSNSRRI